MRLPSLHASSLARAVAAIGVLVTVTIAVTLGYELALLALSTTVLFLIIVLFWSSVRNLSGDTPLSLDEAISMGAPSAAEEQKRAVLRALKDLEFERSVGKISEQDYLDFSARYRAEARKLITVADESAAPAHDLAQKLAAEHLAKAGLTAERAAESARRPRAAEATAADVTSPEAVTAAAPAEVVAEAAAEGAPDSTGPDSAAPDSVAPDSAAALVAGDGASNGAGVSKQMDLGHACPKCQTKNDLDARFCKGCGASLLAPSRAEPAPLDESTEEKIS